MTRPHTDLASGRCKPAKAASPRSGRQVKNLLKQLKDWRRRQPDRQGLSIQELYQTMAFVNAAPGSPTARTITRTCWSLQQVAASNTRPRHQRALRGNISSARRSSTALFDL